MPLWTPSCCSVPTGAARRLTSWRWGRCSSDHSGRAPSTFEMAPNSRRRTGSSMTRPQTVTSLPPRDAGQDQAALMGVSAARILGAIPRAIGGAVVAITKQRPVVDTLVGAVVFVTRDVPELDLERCTTDLATGWTTTADQTVLDLADRPELGDLSRTDVAHAILELSHQVDWRQVIHLAGQQRKNPAASRAAWIAGAPPPRRPGRLVDPLGFGNATSHHRDAYGIRAC